MTKREVGTGADVTIGSSWALRGREWYAFILLLAVTIGLRIRGIDHTPDYDEFFHLLAAQSWLDTGTLCIADCLSPYDRASGFTLAVAGVFALFGESFVSARIPSLVAGCLLIVAVLAWGRVYLSRGAGWIAAWLCALCPLLIGWSQVSRFYIPQALLVWCGAAGVYMVFSRRSFGARGLWILAFSAVCLLSGIHLQVSTLIPTAAMVLWAAAWLLSYARARNGWRWTRVLQGAGAAGVTAVAIIFVWRPEFLEGLWYTYRYGTNLMASAERDNVFFYHAWFSGTHTYLYYLFPAAALVAAARQPKPAGYATTIFTLGLMAHSLGGFKGDRLIAYLMPFFFVVWGIALAEVVPAFVQVIRQLVTRFVDPAVTPRLVRLAPAGLAVAAALFAVVNLEAFQTTVRLATVDDDQWNSPPWYRGHADWAAVQADLAPVADSSDLVLISSSVKGIYYFGRSDAEINRTQLYSTDETFAREFSPDWRVGRPVISEPASIERLVACYDSGLILVESGHWRNPAAVPPATADFIEAVATRIPTPQVSKTLAYRWTSEEGDARPVCDPETYRLMQGA